MEAAIITSWYKTLFDAGFLWVSVAWLSYVVRKIVNAVRKLVLDMIERLRAVIVIRDKTIEKKNIIILDLSKEIAELRGGKKRK